MSTQPDVNALLAQAGVDPAELALLRKMFESPDGRDAIESWTTKNLPKAKATMPHLAVKEDVRALQADLAKERAERAAEKERDKADRERERQKAEIMADPMLRVREGEIADVEKIMHEQHIMAYKPAAELMRSRQRSEIAAPRSDAGLAILPGTHGDDDPYHKSLWAAKTPQEMDRLATQAAYEVFNDLRGGRQSKWAHLMTA